MSILSDARTATLALKKVQGEFSRDMGLCVSVIEMHKKEAISLSKIQAGLANRSTISHEEEKIALEKISTAMQKMIVDLIKWIYKIFANLFNYFRAYFSMAGKQKIAIKHNKISMSGSRFDPGLEEKQKIDVPLFGKIDAINGHIDKYVQAHAEIASILEGVVNSRFPTSGIDLGYFNNVVEDALKKCKEISIMNRESIEVIHESVELGPYECWTGQGWAEDWGLRRVSAKDAEWTPARLSNYLEFTDALLSKTMFKCSKFRVNETRDRMKLLAGTVVMDAEDVENTTEQMRLITNVNAMSALYTYATGSLALLGTKVVETSLATTTAIKQIVQQS